jgi:site-specific recombinase XerD
MFTQECPITALTSSVSQIARIDQRAAGELEPAAVTWQRALELFLNARADSPHTRRAYRRQVTQAMTALGAVTLAQLDGETLAQWRADIVASPLSPSSQSQALAAVRSFLRWSRAVGLHELGDTLIRETLRTPRADVRRPYAVATEPEIRELIERAGSFRDRALIAVLFGAGLRAAEAAGLDVDDLSEDQDGSCTLRVRRGKGRKDRLVPIRSDVATLLRAYLAETRRALNQVGPLFLSEDRARRRADRRLSERAIGYLLEKLCVSARIQAKRISPHAARHTYALRALRSGANVVAVQKLLGHASIATTQRYVDHLETSELRDAVPDLPLGDLS